MPDSGVASGVKAVHRVLQHPVGIGHALMLSHVLEPGIDIECLDEGSRQRGVLIYAPIIGAVAPSLARELRHRREKCRAIDRGDGVFDGDQHRTSVGLDVAREQGSGPMHRRRKIETGGGLKPPAPQQRDRGDQRDRRDNVHGGEANPLRGPSPDDATDGQARELHGCEHRHPAPSDPARQRELG